MTTALLWFRRDLRLADNPALQHARERHEHVVPVFIHAPDEEKAWAAGAAGAASGWWLHHSLVSLGAALEKAGAPLGIHRGGTLETLRRVAKAVGAGAVYWNRLYEPAILARDETLKAALRDDGLEVEDCASHLLYEPTALRTGSGGPYKVFTPFWRVLEERLRRDLAGGRSPLAAVRRLRPSSRAPRGDSVAALRLLPEIGWDAGFPETWSPGEAGAHARIEAFCGARLAGYRQYRDLPALDATSALSPHLHFGEISPLQIAARLERLLAENHDAGVRADAEGFLRQVAWREFAHHLLFHFPETPEQPLNPKFARMAWRTKRDYARDLKAWQRGLTGVPLVDAGMRQLWRTGWMHNRVRLVVASFLTKNLMIPWQEGAAWFWDTLVDADLANNTLGWQWVAGCGADAAPYYRVFNPVLQGGKFDGGGDYVRTWVPELAELPDRVLHAPWEADAGVLEAAGIGYGKDYPEPIVDLKASRERALQAYAEIRD